jgi:arsenate reductase-like glutaredoxin family protein
LIERMGVPVRDALRRKGTPYDAIRLDNPSLTNDPLIDAMPKKMAKRSSTRTATVLRGLHYE